MLVRQQAQGHATLRKELSQAAGFAGALEETHAVAIAHFLEQAIQRRGIQCAIGGGHLPMRQAGLDSPAEFEIPKMATRKYQIGFRPRDGGHVFHAGELQDLLKFVSGHHGGAYAPGVILTEPAKMFLRQLPDFRPGHHRAKDRGEIFQRDPPVASIDPPRESAETTTEAYGGPNGQPLDNRQQEADGESEQETHAGLGRRRCRCAGIFVRDCAGERDKNSGLSRAGSPAFLRLPMKSLSQSLFFGAAFALGALVGVAAEKKIVLLAGSRSHGPGDHEFRAGSLLLAECLRTVPGLHPVVVSNGWPADVKVFEGAAAVVMYADGGQGHPAIRPERLKLIDDLVRKGVGIGALHYGVEVPAGDPGFAMLRWTGGYFEAFWSVNPTWKAEFAQFPVHPITRGVQPFAIDDEWYYHMRFVPDRQGVTPILSVLPPAGTLNRPDGPHSGNPFVRASVAKGESQPLMWAFDRPSTSGGGRGFGFTGGHFHRNWSQPEFRKLVLNAIVWSAGLEVPAGGLDVSVTPAQLAANLDPK